jgi:hypothetical protein
VSLRSGMKRDRMASSAVVRCWKQGRPASTMLPTTAYTYKRHTHQAHMRHPPSKHHNDALSPHIRT